MSETRPPTERPTNVRWSIFSLACLTSWFLYLHRYAWGVIKPEILKEYPELAGAPIGFLDSAFTFAYAFAQVPTGLLGDIFGPGLVLTVIILLWSGIVAVTPMSIGFKSLFASRLAFGLAQAGTYPNLGKVTRSWFPASIRTGVQGMVASTSGRAGGACAALIVGTLLIGTLKMDWKQALLTIAIAGIVFGVIFRLFFRNTPAEHPRANQAEVQLVGSEEIGALGKDVKIRFRDDPKAKRSFFFLNVHIFTSAAADVIFVYWIPLFLSGRGLDMVETGIFTSLPLFAGAYGWHGRWPVE